MAAARGEGASWGYGGCSHCWDGGLQGVGWRGSRNTDWIHPNQIMTTTTMIKTINALLPNFLAGKGA